MKFKEVNLRGLILVFLCLFAISGAVFAQEPARVFYIALGLFITYWLLAATQGILRDPSWQKGVFAGLSTLILALFTGIFLGGGKPVFIAMLAAMILFGLVMMITSLVTGQTPCPYVGWQRDLLESVEREESQGAYWMILALYLALVIVGAQTLLFNFLLKL